MENNKLLAEYVGLTKTFLGIWQPHKNWNELMRVVEKMEEEFYEKLSDAPETPHNGFSLSIGRTVYDEYEAYMPGMGLPAHADTKIEAVYNACVEYVRAKSQNS